jgi:hypothetical protein
VSQIFLGDQSDSSLLLEKASSTGIAKVCGWSCPLLYTTRIWPFNIHIHHYYCLFVVLLTKIHDSSIRHYPKSEIVRGRPCKNLGLGFCPYDQIGAYHILCIFVGENNN